MPAEVRVYFRCSTFDFAIKFDGRSYCGGFNTALNVRYVGETITVDGPAKFQDEYLLSRAEI